MIIKYQLIGFWNGFDLKSFLPANVLNTFKFYKSSSPDYVFYSCFLKNKELLYKYPKSIKIFVSGENLSPDFCHFDYWIGFDFMDFNKRFFRLPQCFILGDVFPTSKQHKNLYFCDFIYSHDREDMLRLKLFKYFSNYKTVSSFGNLFNNTKIFVNRKNKSDYQSLCKFSLIIESTNCEGFVTEKIYDSLRNGCIPIYFGTTKVSTYFNDERFINSNKFNNLNDVLNEVKKIDTNDDLYYSMLNKPIFNPDFSLNDLYDNFSSFLFKIFINKKIVRETEYAPLRIQSLILNNNQNHHFVAKIKRLLSKFFRNS